jgi:hypothetical protein
MVLPRACASCGAARPRGNGRQAPEELVGALSEPTPDQYAPLARMPYRRFVARPRTEPELRAYAEAHGYKPGWVWHRLREQETR